MPKCIPNCLLNHLHSVLNAAAKMFCGCQKYDHATLLIRDGLHWLLAARQRIDFKQCLLTFKSLGGMASFKLFDLCYPTSLRLYPLILFGLWLMATFLFERWAPIKYGNRAFSVAGSRSWNTLAIEIRYSVSFESFERKLKRNLLYIYCGFNKRFNFQCVAKVSARILPYYSAIEIIDFIVIIIKKYNRCYDQPLL